MTDSARTFWTLFLIISIAIFLRTYHLTTAPPGLYPDEAMNGNNATTAWRTGNFQIFYPDNNGREGLFINIQALALGLLGMQEARVLRLVSALFGILTVWGMYFLGRELFSRRAGLLGAFLLATSFWHINFSRIGFRAIMAPFFMVWSAYLLIAGLKKVGAIGAWPLAGYFLSAGVLYGLGFHSYIAYRVTPLLLLPVLIFFWLKSRTQKQQRKFFSGVGYFGLATVLTVVPLLIYFAGHPGSFLGRTSQVSVFSSPTPLSDLTLNIIKTAGMFFWRGDYNWRHNSAGAPELFAPVATLFALGLLLGAGSIIKRIYRKQQINGETTGQEETAAWPAFTFLLLWLALAALPVVISNEGIPHALRAILMAPSVFLLAGAGGVYAYERLRGYIARPLLASLSVLLLGIFALQGFTAYQRWVNNPNTSGAFAADYVTLGRKLNRLPPETPKYIVVEAGGVLVNGIPMPAQTVMFITDTFTPEKQIEKNTHYLLPKMANTIPPNALTFYIR